ncbi:YggS family pyridoxal phosphate-dependent enzyme [Kiloniella sp. EL199]|uniref:YggS family pyridoxal phosphate-dependent enzyme n=1 Tax=Kiloniella sp. EL199 TaxID=2107581 RepID=UPI000EA01B44|nr:YggS family pyridoxal phosphate-dependent enzyme [Kiloniella sp. EL199]
MSLIAENLLSIKEKIDTAVKTSFMNQGDVNLIAVSKTKPLEAVEEAYAAGQKVFGENKVQEALSKFRDLKDQHSDIEVHLIGPLQTNKAKEAVSLFDVIESVDRPKLVSALIKEMKKQDRWPDCFIQVNTGEEEQKAGVLPKDLDSLISFSKEQGLPVIGLMCIPPVDEEAATHFSFLYELAQKHNLQRISMGMSADFEKAVRFGATDVRVGSSIFGERNKI